MSSEAFLNPGVLLVLGVIAALGVLWFVRLQNALVRLNVRVDEAWSDITVQLKRRADLIPNLIESVRGYAKHESQVFENVTQARAATIAGPALTDPAQAAAAENMLQSALKSLFAVAEAYPVLQASENFLSLQAELSDTEDKIMASRRFYNGGVRELNTKIKVWPNSMFAKSLGFSERAFFEVEDLAAVSEAPQVKF